MLRQLASVFPNHECLIMLSDNLSVPASLQNGVGGRGRQRSVTKRRVSDIFANQYKPSVFPQVRSLFAHYFHGNVANFDYAQCVYLPAHCSSFSTSKNLKPMALPALCQPQSTYGKQCCYLHIGRVQYCTLRKCRGALRKRFMYSSHFSVLFPCMWPWYLMFPLLEIINYYLYFLNERINISYK